MGKGNVYIGTSGWHYKHWIGTFYAPGTKPRDQFALYKESFSTVEINNSFYRLPSRDTFKAWNSDTPTGFLFAVKCSRYITHMKKLKDTEEAVKQFLHNARGLGKKLGPILLQLPPGWKVNVDRFKTFLRTLPKTRRFVFEFRNPTWYHPDVYDLLRKHNVAFCQYDLSGHQSPVEVTADFVYVRLHGPGNKYQGSYSHEALANWSKQCLAWSKEGMDVFIYFDNDQAGYAAFNAKTLSELVLAPS
jgi:uncharacterized protein YecE (DUF72 family)